LTGCAISSPGCCCVRIAEVADARKVIAAFDLPENKGKGVAQVDGRMVERMHAEMAQRTVALADAIELAQS